MNEQLNIYFVRYHITGSDVLFPWCSMGDFIKENGDFYDEYNRGSHGGFQDRRWGEEASNHLHN